MKLQEASRLSTKMCNKSSTHNYMWLPWSKTQMYSVIRLWPAMLALVQR